MSIRLGTRAFMAMAMLLSGAPAVATMVIRPTPLVEPECKDPPPPDPVSNYESLPTHAKITEYLSDPRSPAGFRCVSAALAYTGERDDAGIRVVSKYRRGGLVQAETYTELKNGISNLRKHGVVRARRRDGSVQSVEYFCHGFEVGFHRYFDPKGELVAVVDYSRSDYEWEKPQGSQPYREFYVERGKLGSPVEVARSIRFREVYLVHGERADRVAWAAADIFDSRWNALDPASNIKQWTEPGTQGTVLYGNRPTRVRNLDFDYLGFAEVYQRKKLGLPGARKPRNGHPMMFECPWIDEAMEPGLSDARFKFDPPAPLSEAQRAASPRSRFETCLGDPTVDCLLEQALEIARHSQPLQGRAMREFADDALAAGRPTLARLATAEVLADTHFGYTFPNPTFAPYAAIQGQAETNLGLTSEATRSADAAFANAMGPNTHAARRDVRALESIGPRLARVGAFDRARDAYREVPPEYAEDALVTLEELGIAQARMGNIAEARDTLGELTRTAELNAAPDDLSAIVELAAGQADRGDVAAAAATLERIPPSTLLTSEPLQRVNIKAAVVGARLPQSDALDARVEQAIVTGNLEGRLAIATAYCESGNAARGVASLDRARRAEKRPTPEALADMGAAEMKCGRGERAQSDFRAARQAIARIPPYRGDMIGSDPDQQALAHLRWRMLDAGLLDSLPPQGRYENTAQFAIALALKRADRGDATNAWAALEAFRLPDPVQDDQRVSLALARARVLTQLARTDEAERELALARQIALAQTSDLARSAYLVQLAQTRLRNGQSAQTKAALGEAQASFFQHLERSTGDAWLNYGVATLGRAWAAASSDGEATALVMTSRKQLKFRAIAARASDRINGEIAASLARSGAAADSIASLQKVAQSPWRVWFLSQLTAIASQRSDKALSVAAASLWPAILDESQRIVEDASSLDERRRVYHAYLVTLRMKNPPGPVTQRAAALESLRRNLTLLSLPGERLRAGCELAFTYQQLGQTQVASALFTELQAIKALPANVRSTFTRIEKPAPQGACAYWMGAAGTTEARHGIEQLFESRRPWLLSQGGGLQAAADASLRELALVLSESDAGEIDWVTGARLTR